MAQLRLDIGGAELAQIEDDLRHQRAVQRYRAIRRFCYGRVLDYGSGSGYGARLLRQNPDVSAVEEYEPGQEQPPGMFHVFVAMEVLEHVTIPKDVAGYAYIKAPTAIVSFPDLPTTRFNEHHKHDLCRQDVVDLFVGEGFMPFHGFRLEDSQILLFTRRPAGMPARMVRNLLDLR